MLLRPGQNEGSETGNPRWIEDKQIVQMDQTEEEALERGPPKLPIGQECLQNDPAETRFFTQSGEERIDRGSQETAPSIANGS